MSYALMETVTCVLNAVILFIFYIILSINVDLLIYLGKFKPRKILKVANAPQQVTITKYQGMTLTSVWVFLDL